MNSTCPRCAGPLGAAPRYGHCATCYQEHMAKVTNEQNRAPKADSGLPYSGPAFARRGERPARPVGVLTHA